MDATQHQNTLNNGLQNQPIYFDELSLSKFIEEYLDYQIEYAYGELGKISDNRSEGI